MDLIERQKAIDALANTKDLVDVTWTDENDDVIDSIEEKRNIIANWLEKVPSAQPERKTGKWIERKHGYWSFVNDKGERDGWIPSYECSECGSRGWRNPEVMNFCPNCGADMRGEQE